MTDELRRTGADALPGKEVESSAGMGLDADTFLSLLVAELRHQDPMNPVDSKEQMAQLAQLAVVERLDALGEATADLTAHQRSAGATQLVGHVVEGTSTLGTTVRGPVTGVRLGGGSPVLVLSDGTEVPTESVTFVEQSATRPPA